MEGHAVSLIAGLEGPTSHQPFVTPANPHGPPSAEELYGSRRDKRFPMRTTRPTNANSLTMTAISVRTAETGTSLYNQGSRPWFSMGVPGPGDEGSEPASSPTFENY